MRQWKGFLTSDRGFSLVSTLVAVAIGGVVDTLVATIMSQVISSQRSIVDRDELSEFSLFIKSLLTTDTTCSAMLAGKIFDPTLTGLNAPELSLATGYADKPAGPIAKGFSFSNNKLMVASLTLENKGLPPISINIAGGTALRYIARVKLQLQTTAGAGIRSRFFEFPVLIGASNTIVACNGEMNISDACSALGFTLDNSTSPPTCKPASACMTGGSYTTIGSSGSCSPGNPATGGGCSCPPGFTDTVIGAVNITASNSTTKKEIDDGGSVQPTVVSFDRVHQCFKCP